MKQNPQRHSCDYEIQTGTSCAMHDDNVARQSASPHSIVAAYTAWQGTQKGVQSRAFTQQRTGSEHWSARAPVKGH